ncbi:MAG: hypothetical protein Kow00108_08640 [Calditrichia bacterium]
MKKTILIIEDDKNLADLTSTMLIKEGYKCFTAYSAEDGMELLENQKFELLLLDLKLPDMDGVDLVKTLRKNGGYSKNRSLPIIVLTAYMESEDTRKILFELGVSAYLHKPFGKNELLDIIENILLTDEIKRYRQEMNEKLKNLHDMEKDPYYDLPIPVLYLDENLFIRHWNPSVIKEFEYFLQEAPHAPLSIIFKRIGTNAEAGLNKFLKDNSLETSCFIDVLKLPEGIFQTKIYLMRNAEGDKNACYKVILDKIRPVSEAKDDFLNILLTFDHFPLGVVLLSDEEAGTFVQYFNSFGQMVLKNDDLHLPVELSSFRFSEQVLKGIEYVKNKNQLIFLKSERLSLFSQVKADIQMMPFPHAPSKILMVFTPISETESMNSQENSVSDDLVISYPMDFLKKFSHDIRTPMNSIQGFAKLLIRNLETVNSEQIKQDLTTIYRSGFDVQLMLDELIDYGKVSADEIQILPGTVQLNKLVGNLERYLSFLYQDVDFDVQMEEIPEINTDEELLKKVLLYVFHNAIKFSFRSPEKKVTVNTGFSKDSKMLIRINNPGAEIGPEDLEHIFKPFYVGKPVREKYVKGFGLGLFLAKTFIEKLNGTIQISSEKGNGTTVEILLPLF